MRVVFEMAAADARKAEETLRKDDLVGRQSIYVRNAKALGLEGDNVYIVLDGSEEAVNKAKELLKDLAKEAEKSEEILAAFDKIEQAAASGMGFILGGE